MVLNVLIKMKTRIYAAPAVERLISTILSNPNNFLSLDVVDRGSGTQLQVGENSD